MSKVTRVVVLCPNGRRQTVNLTPNSSILQILEEVCQKQNINPDDFDICHYNKPMDLSLPIRFANVPNNAQLELQPAKTARKDCYVTVALQLESGDRIMKDFVPSTSLWDVMDQCLSTKPEESNAEKKGEPVCIYMRQKLIGDAIKNTTLRGLGVTKGSALIRLMYRNPDDLSDQAHVSTPLSKPVKDISPSFSNDKLFNVDSKMECDESSEKQNVDSNISSFPTNISVSTVTPGKQASVIPDLGQNAANMNKNIENLQSFPVKIESVAAIDFSVDNNTNLSQVKRDEPRLCDNKKMEIDSINLDQDQDEEIGAIHYIGGRHAVVYSLDDITETKKADLPEEFFELTIEDARYLMEEFKKSSSDLENKPLLTKELRNRQIQKKLGRFKQTVIRIYFPERLVLQAVFEAQETVQDVIDFIRNFLEDQILNFYLYTSPPKEKKDPTKTLIESMLIPASVVYFGTDSYNSNYLMKSLREKITDPRAASLAAYESRKEAMRETDELQNEFDDITVILPEINADENQVPGPSYEPCVRVQTTNKAPKWLKLSKK